MLNSTRWRGFASKPREDTQAGIAQMLPHDNFPNREGRQLVAVPRVGRGRACDKVQGCSVHQCQTQLNRMTVYGAHDVNLLRRQFLGLAAGAAAMAAVSHGAFAQAYPNKPVRVIVPFGAGGSTDIAARLISQWLSERCGQQFVVENRPGAGTSIGTEVVVRAPPDGYTLLIVSPANAINGTLYDKLNFNFIQDIAPVAGIVRSPLVMEVNSSFPAKTVPEFIAYAKAEPGRINMASSGTGATPHMAGEMFKWMTSINMVHVPYRSDVAAITDLLGGQVQVYFGGLAAAIGYIRTGRLRALAVGTSKRLEVLPDVPTLSEFFPGYEASSWYGVGAPRNTPIEIIDKLNKEINAGLADPKLITRFADFGLMVFEGSTADFREFIGDETEKWGKVVKAANIKPE
jgi:tripartite-type tricarboxylate transporter receptor subunit TctC